MNVKVIAQKNREEMGRTKKNRSLVKSKRLEFVLESNSENGESIDSSQVRQTGTTKSFSIAPVHSNKPAALKIIIESVDETPRVAKKSSRKFQNWQLDILKSQFEKHLPGAYLMPEGYQKIGELAHLTQKQVCKWFANQRSKLKLVAKRA